MESASKEKGEEGSNVNLGMGHCTGLESKPARPATVGKLRALPQCPKGQQAKGQAIPTASEGTFLSPTSTGKEL